MVSRARCLLSLPIPEHFYCHRHSVIVIFMLTRLSIREAKTKAIQTTKSCRLRPLATPVIARATRLPQPAAASCTPHPRAYNPGHSLFDASCLTKWRQNEGQ
jgi:hypothetical protein